MMPNKHTKFQVKSRQGAGLVSKRNTNSEKIAKKSRKGVQKIAKKIAKNQEKSQKLRKSLSVYLNHHRWYIAQTFMADRPNDALQTYKVSGQKSPRGRVGEQKKYKSRKNRKIAERVAKNRKKKCEKTVIARKSQKITGTVCARDADH